MPLPHHHRKLLDSCGGALRRVRGELGVELSGERRGGRIVGDAPVGDVFASCYDEATLVGPILAGPCRLSTFRHSTIENPTAEVGAHLLICDLEGVTITGGNLSEVEFLQCSMDEATLRDLPFGALTATSLRVAHLEAVRLGQAVGSDFTGAHFVRCDFRDADLRASCFRRATFEDCKFDGARVDGTDFRGANGITPDLHHELVAGGAIFESSLVLDGLSRLLPDAAPSRLDQMARRLHVTALSALACLALGAGLLTIAPPVPPASPTLPPPLPRQATAEERDRTKQDLDRARIDLRRAHDTMIAGGGTNRTWPTMREFQDNRFDLDGDGPLEVQEVLFRAGFPENFLTDGEGSVLPYCNEVPDQATLSGVETDWHYCELTGRLFASAGFSEETTLNW